MKNLLIGLLALGSISAFANPECDKSIQDLVKVAKGVGVIEHLNNEIGHGPNVLSDWKELVRAAPKELEKAKSIMRERCNL